MKKLRKVVKFAKKDLKGIFCLEDFYKKFVPEIYEEEKRIKDTRQIRANQKTLDELYDIMTDNILKSKDKRVSGYTARGRKTIIAMDWLCYSPYTSEKVEDFCLELRW